MTLQRQKLVKCSKAYKALKRIGFVDAIVKEIPLPNVGERANVWVHGDWQDIFTKLGI